MALQTKTITANGSRGHHKFTLTVTENSTSVANNTSSVSWVFKMDPIQNGWDWYYTNAVSYSVTINGIKYSGTIDNYGGSGTLTVRSDTISVAHGTDGKKTINYSFSVSSYNVSYLPGSASNSGSMTLTNIPRKATIASAPDFTDIQNPTITYANPAGTAVDALDACISWTGGADIPYRAISKTGTSYTFNFTDAERQKLWTAVTSGYTKTVKFYVRTTLGGAYHYSTLDKTLTLVDASPTLAPTVIDEGQVSTELTGDASGKMIRYYNILRYLANATARKGATIINAGCWNSNINYAGVAGYINYSGDNAFKFWVEDSRGNRTEKTITKTMIDYINLTINAKVSTPTINGDIDIEVSGNYWSGNFGASENTLQVQMRRKDGNDEWGDWGNFSVISYPVDNRYTGSKTYRGLDYTKTYTFQFRAYDKVHQLTYGNELYTPEIAKRALPVFDWGESDFNFNVPVNINGNLVVSGTITQNNQPIAVDDEDPAADYVIETGTTAMGSNGTWYWRKWNSGRADCYGCRNYGNMGVSTAWGVLYRSEVFSQTLPSGLFTSIPEVVDITFRNSNFGAWIAKHETSAPSASNSGSFIVVRPASATLSQAYISFNVIGRWK